MAGKPAKGATTMMTKTLRRAAPVLAVAALLATAAASPAYARPTSLLAGRPGTAGKVPAGFQPAAASFISSTSGVVLGGIGCRLNQACTARLAATTDGGAQWRFLKAPDAQVNSVVPANAVDNVVFASRRNGWLYDNDGPGLWATHDRGRHWRKLSLGGDIEQMATSAGIVYAVVARHGFTAPWQLFASPAGADAWARVGNMTASNAILAVSGRSAWFANRNEPPAGSTNLWATADGAHWHRYPFRCAGTSHVPARYYGLASMAAASPSHVVFLCMTSPGAGSADMDVMRSVNGGKTTHLAGPGPSAGDEGTIAVPPEHSNVITIAGNGGNGVLCRSANGGKSWQTAFTVIGGTVWNSLSYVTADVGWVVFGQPGYGSRDNRLLRTSEAGRSWHEVRF
jgi:hypothetical protein